MEECPRCHGNGYTQRYELPDDEDFLPEDSELIEEDCEFCEGTGEIIDDGSAF